MSAASFTVVSGTCSLTAFDKNDPKTGKFRSSRFQDLEYIVQEANGSRFQVAIVWNKKFAPRKFPMYPILTPNQSEMLRQATLREMQYHGITLSAAELGELRFPERTHSACMRSRISISPPTPIPAPAITPTAIAATLNDLQSQISKLTAEIATLRAQLQDATSDKARLTQQLADTQAQLLVLTDAFRQLLTQQ
jgi:hypothetical protein